MINLKLAEYKERKFQKFQKFLYLGDFLLGDRELVFLDSNEEGADYYYGKSFDLDEKDPLNRFDGLFDGFTYGNGRFVLIKGGKNTANQDIWHGDIMEGISSIEYKIKNPNAEKIYFYLDFNKTIPKLLPERRDRGIICGDIIGNLHENPELYDKI